MEKPIESNGATRYIRIDKKFVLPVRKNMPFFKNASNEKSAMSKVIRQVVTKTLRSHGDNKQQMANLGNR
jgi:hypothetical protein